LGSAAPSLVGLMLAPPSMPHPELALLGDGRDDYDAHARRSSSSVSAGRYQERRTRPTGYRLGQLIASRIRVPHEPGRAARSSSALPSCDSPGDRARPRWPTPPGNRHANRSSATSWAVATGLTAQPHALPEGCRREANTMVAGTTQLGNQGRLRCRRRRRRPKVCPRRGRAD